MTSETIENLKETTLLTPRRSKNIEDEMVVLAPDARRALRKQLDNELINELDWYDESNHSKIEKVLQTPLKAMLKSSIYTKHLITPKRGFVRDSILSTGTPRGNMSQYYLDLTYDCISVYGNDSDPESCFERKTSPIKNVEISENIKNVSLENSNYYNNRFVSLCKRDRESLEFEAGGDSPSDLVQIMSKSLRLS